MVGRSASELSKNREARDAFSVAARSSDPQLAGRALAMQAAIAVDEKRWSDAASSYSAAASKLSGQEAQIARERAQRADAKANESRLPPRPATAIQVVAAAPQPPAAPKATTTPRAPQVAPAPAPVAVTAVADDGTPWTIRAGTFSSRVAAQQHASGLAKEAKRAGLPTPRVLLAKSDDKPQRWIVEIGSFDQREQGEAARKKFATRDTIVVRTCAPASSKRS
jgi:cell division protein FtsN